MNSTRRVLALGITVSLVLAATATASNATASNGQDRPEAAIGPLSMVQVKPNGKPVGGDSTRPAISANGRYVTYVSENLRVVGMIDNGAEQVLRYDRRTDKTILVSVTPDGAPGERDSSVPTISADGSVVAFTTYSGDLLPGSPGLYYSVSVVRDLDTAHTTLISHTPTGGIPHGNSFEPVVSADGSLVSFATSAPDITGVDGAVLFDGRTGQLSAVTVDTTHGPYTPDSAYVSGDGQWIAFDSTDSGIVPGDDNGVRDVFLLNRASGDVTLVSRSADGTVADATSRLIYSYDFRATTQPFTSADGSTVAFISDASDLAGAENPSHGYYYQGYAFHVASGLSELVTALPDGAESEDVLTALTPSPDGRYIAIQTQAFLAGGDGPIGGPKMYVRDLQRQETRAVSDEQMAFAPALGGRTPHVVFVTYEALLAEDVDFHDDVYTRRAF